MCERASPRTPWMTSGAAPVRSAEWPGCLGSPPSALAHEHRPHTARWHALFSRSTLRTRTVTVAGSFDRARPAAVLDRPGTLQLRHAAWAQNKSGPGLLALASPSGGGRQGTPAQTWMRSSDFILLDGSKCVALARWLVPTILASTSRQKWVGGLASPAGRGHMAM